MLDMKAFGEKLKNHRKNLGFTQEEVADKIGVSAQAVSKWEAGECLPDCFNLKALGDTYKISLDILLETAASGDIDAVSAKIEQLGDEFIWAKANRDAENAHRDLGDDLWKMWKGLYFIEIGNKEYQKRDKERGNTRICSKYGMKIWDDDGVACVVKSSLRDKLGSVGEHELSLLREMSTADGFKLLSSLDTNTLTPKADLIEKTGIEQSRLNELLLTFSENMLIEFVYSKSGSSGYKIGSHFGISAYMLLASAYILSKNSFTVSEYIDRIY